MKIRQQARLAADATVVAGDTLTLYYTDEHGKKVTVAEEVITEPHTFDSAVIFEAEPGEFGADYGLGGVFLEHKVRAGG